MISPRVSAGSTRKRSPLSALTTLGVGGPADMLCAPETVEEAQALVLRARRLGVPLRVLGRGSNLIVADDGVEGFVIRTERMQALRFGDGGRVTAGAGLSTARLLAETRVRGLGGLECLVGYPASVGGVARMNAGGKWGNAGDRIEAVTVVDPDGEVRVLTREECRFGYRSSSLGGRLVVEVRFRLPRVDAQRYRGSVRAIHDEKARAQPLDRPSAGCIFKNPGGDSAGRIVDACGLKGAARGGASISLVHGNFVVNDGSASADDVLGLITEVREAVASRANVDLELEVEVWRR